MQQILIDTIFEQTTLQPDVLLDVRTPAEYLQGHIPGAINLPLFSDQERKIVGTLYKQAGKDIAFDKGLSLVGTKLAGWVKKAKELTAHRIVIYCWRGGMRSGSMNWLFQMAGINSVQLAGGYKAYRTYIRQAFMQPANILILGGRTGVGKTRLLHELHHQGEQVLDLEGLADHLGSAFGKINNQAQPTNEQFENNCFKQWRYFDLDKRIWIESESRNIGKVSIVPPLFDQMLAAPMCFIETDRARRIEHIIEDYSAVPAEKLIHACSFIKKKISAVEFQEIITAIESDDYRTATNFLLDYYDRLYDKTTKKNNRKTVKLGWQQESIKDFCSLLIAFRCG